MNKKDGKVQEITITATRAEWRAVEDLITSHRRQCRSQRSHDTMLAHLEDFQKRLTKATRNKSPDDYFI